MMHCLGTTLDKQVRLFRPLLLETTFFKGLLAGKASRSSYATFIGNIFYFYDALEKELELNRERPVKGLIYLPELYRVPSLEQDCFL